MSQATSAAEETTEASVEKPDDSVIPVGPETVKGPALGVLSQKPNRTLGELNLDDFEFLKGRQISVSKDKKSVSIIGGSREEALRDAGNVMAIAGSDLELASSYEDPSDDSPGRWLIVLRRKE
jgi:hypothetical protein